MPMLVLPLFFDQHRNARAVEYRGLGRALNPPRLTADSMFTALKELLDTPAYRERAQRNARLFRTKPDQPDETLVKWVQFVLTNGPLPELRPELERLNFVVYNNLDIAALAICLIMFVSYVIYRSTRTLNALRQSLREPLKLKQA